MGKWLNELWSIHAMESYWVIKRNELDTCDNSNESPHKSEQKKRKQKQTKTLKFQMLHTIPSSVSNIVEMMTFQRWGRSVLDPRWRVGCGYNATAWETLGEAEFLGPDCQRQDRGCDFTPQFRTMLPLSEAGENGRGISRHCFLLLHANLQWSQNQGVQLKNSAHVICSIF